MSEVGGSTFKVSGAYWPRPTPPASTHQRVARVEVRIKINGVGWDTSVYAGLSDGVTNVPGSNSILQGSAMGFAVGNFTWTQDPGNCVVGNTYGGIVGPHLLTFYPTDLTEADYFFVSSVGPAGLLHPASIDIDYIKWAWAPTV